MIQVRNKSFSRASSHEKKKKKTSSLIREKKNDRETVSLQLTRVLIQLNWLKFKIYREYPSGFHSHTLPTENLPNIVPKKARKQIDEDI